MKIGIQLFSVRKCLETPEQMDETFKRVKEMGYQCVQLSGFQHVKEKGAGFDVEQVNALIAKYGLEVNLTHIAPDRLENDLDAVIADHKAIGCANIGLGSMPGVWGKFNEGGVDEAFVAEFVEKYDAIAKKIAEAGLKFFYHNHAFEFVKLPSGQTIMDYIIEKSKYINFTLDTHWLQRGGVSIIEYIKKLNGRIECVHLKDYIMVDNNTVKFAPVGVGVINWADVVSTLKECSVKYAFVEQDDAVDYDDPFGQIEISAKNLIKWGFVK